MASSETSATSAAADSAAHGLPAADSSISDEEVSALLEQADGADGSHLRVRPYDLTSQRISQTQLPMLETVARSFAAGMASALASLLGRESVVQFAALEHGKAAEMQAALPVPGTLASIRLKPLPGLVHVSVAPALLLALLDNFFGGPGRMPSDMQAAIAPAAQRFLALMLRSCAGGLISAWAPIAPLEFEIVKLETNPRLMQLGTAQEAMVALRFNVEVGAHSGEIHWLLPEAALAPVREALAAEGGQPRTFQQAAWGPELVLGVQEAEVETRVVLAQAKISLRELVLLSPGDIIPIEAPQHATLLAGEVAVCHGRFGVSHGRNALKILSRGAT